MREKIYNKSNDHKKAGNNEPRLQTEVGCLPKFLHIYPSLLSAVPNPRIDERVNQVYDQCSCGNRHNRDGNTSHYIISYRMEHLILNQCTNTGISENNLSHNGTAEYSAKAHCQKLIWVKESRNTVILTDGKFRKTTEAGIAHIIFFRCRSSQRLHGNDPPTGTQQ